MLSCERHARRVRALVVALHAELDWWVVGARRRLWGRYEALVAHELLMVSALGVRLNRLASLSNRGDARGSFARGASAPADELLLRRAEQQVGLGLLFRNPLGKALCSNLHCHL